MWNHRAISLCTNLWVYDSNVEDLIIVELVTPRLKYISMPSGSIALQFNNAWSLPLSDMLVVDVPRPQSIVLTIQNSHVSFSPKML